MEDRFAIGEDSVLAELKRLRLPSHVQFSPPATWGTSALRDRETTENGGTISASSGQLLLSTSTNANGRAQLESLERCMNRSGTWSNPSIGLRVPNADALEGNQVIRAGMFDDDYGVGYGIDATGAFLFRRVAASDTLYRPSVWNGIGVSDPVQMFIDGFIAEVVFQWYGHGPILWFVKPKNAVTHWNDERPLHQLVFPGELNFVEPNQPLRVEVDNNGTSGSDLECYVGGRQYSLWGDPGLIEKRNIPVVRRSYSLGTNSATNGWEPVIAVREKSTLAGRTNSVRTVIREIAGRADGDYELLATFGAETNSSYGNTPSDYPSGETAVEVDVGSFTVSSFGTPVAHLIGGGSFFQASPVEEQTRVVLGTGTEIVLWVRGAATTLEVATVSCEEQR